MALGISLLVALTSASVASAAVVTTSERFVQFGSEGTAAGQLGAPTGIATDPRTGHVYVAGGDFTTNNRIDEFTPWGEFVKAFGWDVAPGAVSEEQELRVRATAGQFRLGFGASTTPDLPFDATAAQVQSALNALPSISGGGGEVGVEGRVGNPTTGVTPYIYLVNFKGSLAASNVGQLSIMNGTVPVSGGSPTTELEARTRADGTAGGTGFEACTARSGCKRGLNGAGVGEFNEPGGVAVSADGDIYVFEGKNQRVQRFDSAGRFELMFGGGVNQGPLHPGNLCTAAHIAEGDSCGAGSAGAGNGQFGIDTDGSFGWRGTFMAFGPDGVLYVGDKGRIQSFEPDGTYKSQFDLDVDGNPGALAFDSVSGHLYFAYSYTNVPGVPNVFELDPSTGDVLGELTSALPKSIATDGEGNVYVVEYVTSGFPTPKVLEFDATGALVGECCNTDSTGLGGGARFGLPGIATGSHGSLYAISARADVDNYVRGYGPPPAVFESPAPVPPGIGAQYAASVSDHDATLRAEINPHFWQDTTYYVQYGTADCAANPCTSIPVPPGTQLTNKVVDTALTAEVPLDGLQPSTTYHFRFVAQSSGGGPVFGLDRTFTTFPASSSQIPCSNEAFRSGLSGDLPDCRAYEMVSPVDKNGGDILALLTTLSWSTALSRSSNDGEKLTYTSYIAFGNPEGAPYASQYISTRQAGLGWFNEPISPSRGGPSFFDLGTAQRREFKVFTGDLCKSWLVHDTDPPLTADAPPGYAHLYRRDNCGGGSYEVLSKTKPTLLPDKFRPELQGISEDGSHAIFRVNEKLTTNASGAGNYQLYEAFGNGSLRLVSVLPSNQASEGNSSAGTANEPLEDGAQSVANAISTDGSHIFWTTGATELEGVGRGKIYLRIGGKNPTVKVSETVSTEPAYFQGAGSDGGKALFSIGSDLYEFRTAEKASSLIAHKVLGQVLGMSADASSVYLVSEEVLASGGVAGKPNLYLYKRSGTGPSSYRFITALSAADAKIAQDEVTGSPLARTPVRHSAVVSESGGTVVFTSTASLTGYDNLDANSGVADTEVYLYDAAAAGGAGKLRCISCNPTGARPTGKLIGPYNPWKSRWLAGWLATPSSQLYSPRVLSEDGKRAFFNSFDALVLADTNEAADVYQWEAPGTGDCKEGSGDFSAPSEGCLSLISSGRGEGDSEFIDASPSGRDVFFSTATSLLPQDPGQIDIYDARENGGLPIPPGPIPPCEGEGCRQTPNPPPNDPAPSSATFSGPGNQTPKPRCKKGKVRRNGHCVKRKRHGGKKHGGKRKHQKGKVRR